MESKRKPRKPLTTEQRRECEDLKAIFEEKAKHKGITQGDFGIKNGIGEQGLVTQYLNAKIPLNLEVAIKFANGLGVSVKEFAARFEDVLSKVPGYREPDRNEWKIDDDRERLLINAFRQLSEPHKNKLQWDADQYKRLQDDQRAVRRQTKVKTA